MISIIIPALNEGATIYQVVRLAIQSDYVEEVIVVDDRSLDNTVDEAFRAGAKVITGTKLGKGASMKDGLMVATQPVIVFLDADIENYPNDVVKRMADPILSNSCDFVKSYFTRQAGRVTELVAKPLLSILMPEFPSFRQPLSGMIAGKKDFFDKIEFQDGYGVDIGILMDMHLMGARILEVAIGHIENKMQSLEQLGRMSREVATVIMEKSAMSGTRNLETLERIQVIREQMEFAIKEKQQQLSKIAVIDMDRTLLRDSFIHRCALKFNFLTELIDIITSQSIPFIRTKQIAKLLKGRTVNELIQVAEEIPITRNAERLIYALREKGYTVGIISDSYDYITNYFVNKLHLDFSLANELEFSKSVVTGEVKIPSFFLPNKKSICTHELCKTHALIDLCSRMRVELSNTMAIGDSENDICLIKHAGIGISFCATYPTVKLVADMVFDEPDMQLIADFVSG